jgi:PhoH-like ATPase
MPLPPIPTQAADKLNINRQPKAELKKRPKRIEIEEVDEVTELVESSISLDLDADDSHSLADIAIEKMRAPSKSIKKSSAPIAKNSTRVRKIPDDGIIRLFVLDTNVLMHDPSALFRFEEHDVYLPMMTLEELDNHKKGMSEVARNARTVSRSLDQLVANTSGVLGDGIPLSKLGNKDATGSLYFQIELNSITLPDGLPTGKADNMILGVVRELQQSRKDRQVVLVSKDINMRIKARALGLPAEDYFNDQVLEDRDLMYSGILQLPVDFWPKHGKDMESWSDAKSGTMFYRVTGPTVPHMMVNQFVYQENSDGGTPFYAQVREVQGKTALLQTLRDFSHQKTMFGVSRPAIANRILQ